MISDPNVKNNFISKKVSVQIPTSTLPISKKPIQGREVSILLLLVGLLNSSLRIGGRPLIEESSSLLWVVLDRWPNVSNFTYVRGLILGKEVLIPFLLVRRINSSWEKVIDLVEESLGLLWWVVLNLWPKRIIKNLMLVENWVGYNKCEEKSHFIDNF